MTIKRTNIILLLGAAIVLAFILKDTFTQSGVEELKGGFEVVAKYRNPNNTGPVQQLYTVTVNDTAQAQLLAYGNLMPHHKYGTTKVYFFPKGTSVPHSLSPGKVNFDAKFNPSCFALYEKDAMGQVELTKHPFK